MAQAEWAVSGGEVVTCWGGVWRVLGQWDPGQRGRVGVVGPNQGRHERWETRLESVRMVGDLEVGQRLDGRRGGGGLGPGCGEERW